MSIGELQRVPAHPEKPELASRRRRPRRSGRILPILLAAPALLWLAVFYLAALLQTARAAFAEPGTGLKPTGWSLANFESAIVDQWPNIRNTLLIGGTSSVIALAVGITAAYLVVFHGGRRRNLLLFLLLAPFLTSYIIRVIAWQTLLGGGGPVIQVLTALRLVDEGTVVVGTPFAVIAGLTYQLIPFVTLPMYLAFSRVDQNVWLASGDLYASRPSHRWVAGAAVFGVALGLIFAAALQVPAWSLKHLVLVVAMAALTAFGTRYLLSERFLLVALPMAAPGVVAAALLSFIPALGDYVNAALLGNVRTQMVGNVIQQKFLVQLDYPGAAALAMLLLVVMAGAVTAYLRVVGGKGALDSVG